MNIKNFKENDIITRNEPVTYAHSGDADGSYLGSRIILVGVDEKSKIIFLVAPLVREIELSYARDGWDEGWEYYPETLLEKAKKLVRTQSVLKSTNNEKDRKNRKI